MRWWFASPEFDDLAKAVGLNPSTSSGRTGNAERAVYGVTDPAERAKLRAELDGGGAFVWLDETDVFWIPGRKSAMGAGGLS
ncbi:MAG: hypothetical protein IPI14_05060 [Polaromonas sp.]|nr:hypothetical protein [Polaromonas sp.]